MNTSYRIQEMPLYRPEHRDYIDAFQVQYVKTELALYTIIQETHAGSRTEVLATYTTRAAAELVISALRAAQNDLNV